MSDEVKISVWGWDSTGSAAVRHVLQSAGLTVAESDPFEGNTQALLEALGELPDGSHWAVVAVTPSVQVSDEKTEELARPTGSIGNLGQKRVALQVSEELIPGSADADADGRPPAGWQRAVFEVGGEIIREKREELPMNVEELAPFLELLHTSGEQAVLKVSNGRKYSLWGWPDLERPNSKVLAVGWGEPVCELIALHRAPVQTGLCIQEVGGMLPQATESVADVCEAVTGQSPSNCEGQLFAVQGDGVWILRGKRVIHWDGRRESDAGSPKQALVSLALHWSNR